MHYNLILSLSDTDMDQEKIDLHNTLIKQQELLLKQYEVLTREKEKKEEEIDLGKWFTKILSRKKKSEKGTIEQTDISQQKPDWLTLSIDTLVLAVKKGIKLTLGFGLVGLALGFVLYFTSEPVYKSTMVISSGSMPNNYYSSLLFTLEELVGTKSYPELSRKLKMPLEDAEKIKAVIYQDYLQEELLEEDSTLEVFNRPFFKVYVEITDNSILPQLQTGIFDYVTNNNYTRRRRDARKMTLENNIKKLDSELRLMDSLKVAIIRKIEADEKNDSYFVRESGIGGGLILSEDKKLEVDPMEAFNKSKSMHDEQQNSLRSLLLIENEVDIVDDFAEYARPVFPRLRHVAFVAIAFGIIGYLISLVVVFRSVKNRILG